jgi:hypothetical protein
MSIAEFKQLTVDERPQGMSGALFALLQAARGNWDAAHESAQADETPNGAWVHAYLHRKEGDPGNAAYWYRRAARPFPKCGIEAEWEQIAAELLRQGAP